jgi:5-(aminomethyl)-3-furanmethanol phosphate kinase
MWVIKLGGSLLAAEELKLWLRLIHEHGDGKVIIVPGGSVFANAVRQADSAVKLSSRCAHQLAIMAMDQYALLLKDLEPELVIGRSELEIAGRSWQHRGLVWMPSPMLLADKSIPEDWSITSDTLAAWLAKKLNAEHLVLVKSIRSKLSLNNLIASEVIDSAFGEAIQDAPYKTWMLHKSDCTHFTNGFNSEVLSKIGHPLVHI